MGAERTAARSLDRARLGWRIAFLLGVAVVSVVIVVVFKLEWFPFPRSRTDVLHIPVCGVEDQGAPLFTLRVKDGRFTIIPGMARPDDDSVFALEALERGVVRTMRIDRQDRYWYHVRYTGTELEWWLAGAALRPGDEVGRAPIFAATGRFSYAVGCTQAGADGRRLVPLWMDGLPANALRMLPQVDCRINEGPDACIEMLSGAGRTTLERHSTSRGSEAQFLHVQPGQPLRVGPQDRLWIAHLPFDIRQESGGGDEWDMRLPDDYQATRGDRSRLGRQVFGRHTVLGEDDLSVDFFAITELFRGRHLIPERWSPMLEDEYQLLIDHELLCVEWQSVGGRRLPQLTWKDPMKPGCHDLVAPLADTRPALPPPPPAVFEVYRRRLTGDDGIIRRANHVLAARVPSSHLDDLPFTFEWWPVEEGGVTMVPNRVWGTRTLSTIHYAALERERQRDIGAQQRDKDAQWSRRRVVLASRGKGGERAVLAWSDDNTRKYADNLYGLGPLLGRRGVVPGVDTALKQVARPTDPDAQPTDVQLTIDARLQQELWSALKGASRELQISPDAAGRSAYGFTAVALDPASGDVLAALNWPEGTWWEDPADLHLTGAWIPDSVNRAFRRAEKTGSTLKALTLYTIANAGLLDHPVVPTAAGPTCGGSKDSPTQLGMLVTRDDLTVQPGGSRAFADKQAGPLPVSHAAIAAGLPEATGHSCNAFFAFTAAMLLSGQVPDVSYPAAGCCPIDAALRRSDVPDGSWMVCRLCSAPVKREMTRRYPLGRLPAPDLWLLAPPHHQLFERSVVQTSLAHQQGYFPRAIAAGYRFDRRLASGVTDHGRAREYEGQPLRSDWFPELGSSADQWMFAYPRIKSPGTLFGWASDEAGQREQPLAPREHNWWHELASEVIGEGTTGSALSLAVLYTPIARVDAAFPAPRLVRTAAEPVSPALPAFDATVGRRRQQLRIALSAPVRHGGTAWKSMALRDSMRAYGVQDRLIGKTGTFDLRQLIRPPLGEATGFGTSRTASKRRRACGVPVGLGPQGPDFRSQLGTETCERAGLLMTGVHRYPERPPPEPDDVPKGRREKYHATSFVGVLDAPGEVSARQEQTGMPRSVVLSVVADVPFSARRGDVTAADILGHLLPKLAAWLEYPQLGSRPRDLGTPGQRPVAPTRGPNRTGGRTVPPRRRPRAARGDGAQRRERGVGERPHPSRM
jgi:hypothetical protein